MRNPVNRLATAAPRALDSLLEPKDKSNEKSTRQDRTCSFDLDLSGLKIIDSGSSLASASIDDEGSVVTSLTLEQLSSELSSSEFSVDWTDTMEKDASPN